MRMFIFLSLIIAIISSINGNLENIREQRSLPISSNPYQGGRTYNQNRLQSNYRNSFPQCLSTQAAGGILSPASVQKLFQVKLQEEDSKLKHERIRNDNIKNNDILDFDALQLRKDTHNGALVARTATKVSETIVTQLGCETSAAVTQQLDSFLKKIAIPADACPFLPYAKINCTDLEEYRSQTGVCNNLQRPYQGSSQTAFARLLPAAYNDGLRTPRSQSVLGGPLPDCRSISLSYSSKPVFDTTFNNAFVAFGQFISHDISLAQPVTDSGRTPITSCTCGTHDPDQCLVIDIPYNDPYMAGQKCMSLPATAQGLSDEKCTLGVKDQMNANTHFIDLSVTYGSTKKSGDAIRTMKDGLLKVAKKSWSKYVLPPGQVVGKTCVDSTSTERCFAGGDSRLMENMLLGGIQVQWLRVHNNFARALSDLREDWRNKDDILYDEARKIVGALEQRYVYEDWLPMLIGNKATQLYTGDKEYFSKHNPNLPGVVFNEAVTAVLRLHKLVRDLYSRCTPKGQLIDQLWLHDINAKCKFAYDAKHNGVDSILCGGLYDFGSAGGSNFAHEIHHRLFESKNKHGEIRRNDLIAINICRGREHGIPPYNAFRQLCGLKRASRFQDFSDTISYDHIKKLESIYAHPDDVDLFVGANYENHVPDGLVGPVSACIIGIQFHHLKYGDRFFYTHKGQFSKEQRYAIHKYTHNCFMCHSTDIDAIPVNAFRPPNDKTNPLKPCSQCQLFDFSSWSIDAPLP